MEHPDVTMMYVVHEAFRRDLARMQAAAAQVVNPDMHQALRDSWTAFNQYLTIHHTAEDEVLWPPMRAKLGTGEKVGVLDEMLDEHSRLEPLLRKIDNALHQASPARLTPSSPNWPTFWSPISNTRRKPCCPWCSRRSARTNGTTSATISATALACAAQNGSFHGCSITRRRICGSSCSP
jgi:hypothetical protein